MDIAIGSTAVSLPCVDVAVLSQAARIDALTELQRARAWVDAAETRVLAALVEPGEVPRRRRVSAAVEAKQYVREEIACALQISPMTVNERLHIARTLSGSLPSTLESLERGDITMRHARTLVEGVGPLDPIGRTTVEAAVLAKAAHQTPTRFRQSVARAVMAADPRSANERHESARAERRVETRTLEDGMGSLLAVLPAEDLQAVREAIDAAADAHPDHDPDCARVVGVGVSAVPDPNCASCASRARTAGQRRADALVSLMLELDTATVRSRHGRAPAVQVTVALSTLRDLDDQPGHLDGYGPIPADVARRMAGDPSGTWRRLVTDQLGRLVDYGRRTYRPPQDLTDHVIARDRYCRFPGCGRQARNCELDHLLDWDLGGHTNERNLVAGCPRHHHLRHDAGWRVEGEPGGTLTWITPTGHSYGAPPGEHPIDTTTRGDPDPPGRSATSEYGGRRHDPPVEQIRPDAYAGPPPF